MNGNKVTCSNVQFFFFLKKDTTSMQSKRFILIVIDKKYESSTGSNRSLIRFSINSDFRFQSGLRMMRKVFKNTQKLTTKDAVLDRNKVLAR